MAKTEPRVPRTRLVLTLGALWRHGQVTPRGQERGTRSGFEDTDGHGSADTSPSPCQAAERDPMPASRSAPLGKTSTQGIAPKGTGPQTPLSSPHPPNKRVPNPNHGADMQKGPQEKKTRARGCCRTVPNPVPHVNGHKERCEVPRAPAIPSPRSPSLPKRGMAALEPLGTARREDAWDFFFFFGFFFLIGRKQGGADARRNWKQTAGSVRGGRRAPGRHRQPSSVPGGAGMGDGDGQGPRGYPFMLGRMGTWGRASLAAALEHPKAPPCHSSL